MCTGHGAEREVGTEGEGHGRKRGTEIGGGAVEIKTVTETGIEAEAEIGRTGIEREGRGERGLCAAIVKLATQPMVVFLSLQPSVEVIRQGEEQES